MYNTKKVVGDFFEEKIVQLFDLIRIDPQGIGRAPDLVARDGSFYVEVKASAYNNGGVIKRAQLYRFDKDISVRRFYVFVYHSIIKDMEKLYSTEEELKRILDLKSLFLFPFSTVKAHFEKSKKSYHHQVDFFVQLKENMAADIFLGDEKAWKHLGLESNIYARTKPHEKVHIVTRNRILEKEILASFHPEFL